MLSYKQIYIAMFERRQSEAPQQLLWQPNRQLIAIC